MDPARCRKKDVAMEFRWIAVLALWTMLVGPMLDMSKAAPRARSQATRSAR
jgi:hypothetical protein